MAKPIAAAHPRHVRSESKSRAHASGRGLENAPNNSWATIFDPPCAVFQIFNCIGQCYGFYFYGLIVRTKKLSEPDTQVSFSTFTRQFDIIRVGMAVSWLLLLTLVFYFFDDVTGLGSDTDTVKLVQTICGGLIPVSILFVVSFMFLKGFDEVQQQAATHRITLAVSKALALNEKQLQLHDISYSYIGTDWRSLLEGCTKVDICMFYASNSWLDTNVPIFRDFAKNGGEISFFLPNPTRVTGKFFGTVEVDEKDKSKILETSTSLYRALQKEFPATVKINFANRGFNYMFARFVGNSKKVFMFSPYTNNRNNADSPAIMLDQNTAPEELAKFVEMEFENLDPSEKDFNYEASSHLVWRAKQKKVFVSSDLHCAAKCAFCFVESLKDQQSDPFDIASASLFYKSIITDKRFESGKHGTVIMLGGFTDPFHPRNIDFSITLINQFASVGNSIHVATRFPLGERSDEILNKQNLVVNFSVATTKNKRIEPVNFHSRMNDAKALIKAGFNVTLFVRPVIADVTIHEIPEIIEVARSAGIDVVTVGGIYVNDQIRKRLATSGIEHLPHQTTEGVHVLDSEKSMEKLANADVETVVAMFESSGFTVFRRANDRINHFLKDHQ